MRFQSCDVVVLPGGKVWQLARGGYVAITDAGKRVGRFEWYEDAAAALDAINDQTEHQGVGQ